MGKKELGAIGESVGRSGALYGKGRATELGKYTDDDARRALALLFSSQITLACSKVPALLQSSNQLPINVHHPVHDRFEQKNE